MSTPNPTMNTPCPNTPAKPPAMNTCYPDPFEAVPPANNTKGLVIAGACLGAGLLVVGLGLCLGGRSSAAPAPTAAAAAPSVFEEQRQMMREAMQMAKEAQQNQREHMARMRQMMEDEREGGRVPGAGGGD